MHENIRFVSPRKNDNDYHIYFEKITLFLDAEATQFN